MSKNWSSSKFRRYLNSHNIQDEIIQFARKVDDLRANATVSSIHTFGTGSKPPFIQLIVATGTRMDLAGVASGIAAVEDRISDLRRELVEGRSSSTTTPADGLKQELARFEEDVSQPYTQFLPL
jgi:hypothetical protein